MSRPHAFPRTKRLSGRNAFARVFGGRHSAGNRFLVVYAMPNDLRFCRLGLSVGRRCGNAVKRSRLKRILREAFRLESHRLPPGFDLVCLPRPGVDLTLETARKQVIAVANRAADRATRSTGQDR